LSYVTMDGMFALKDEVVKEQQYIQNVNRFIQRFQKDISNMFLLQNNKEDARVKTLFKSKKEFYIDSIVFVSFSHLRVHFNAKESDQCEISYFGEKDKDSESGYVIKRRESSFIDDKPEEGGEIHTVLKNIKSFHCTYFKTDNEEWVEEWDTEGVETGRKLPPYVNCELVVYRPITDEDDELTEESYRFSAKINLKEAIE
ncbi:hypothetical protein JXR93_05285, partial [bacterium]|nr:hypothetical protein [bacterium]